MLKIADYLYEIGQAPGGAVAISPATPSRSPRRRLPRLIGVLQECRYAFTQDRMQ